MKQTQRLFRLVTGLDALSEWTGRLIAWLTLIMVLTTASVVVLRYLFDYGNVAVQESIIYMHSFVFMLGAAFTLKHDGHVRVDIFYRPRSARFKAWINLFGSLFLLLPVCGFIFWISWDYVATSWSYFEGSQEAGGLPWRYLLKSVLLVMPVLMILQGFAEIGRSILIINGTIKPETQVQEHAL